MSIKRVNLTTIVDGVQIYASVSPCCWMYPGYKMQVKINLGEREEANNRSQFINWPTPYAQCTDEEFYEHVVDFATKGGIRKLKQRNAEVDAMEAEFAKLQALHIAAERQKDAEHKAAGYTHKVIGWVHPKEGDDFSIRYYIQGKPSHDSVQSVMLRHGCTLGSDFQITEL